MTVKEAIEKLKKLPEDAEVTDLKVEFVNCKPIAVATGVSATTEDNKWTKNIGN